MGFSKKDKKEIAAALSQGKTNITTSSGNTGGGSPTTSTGGSSSGGYSKEDKKYIAQQLAKGNTNITLPGYTPPKAEDFQSANPIANAVSDAVLGLQAQKDKLQGTDMSKPANRYYSKIGAQELDEAIAQQTMTERAAKMREDMGNPVTGTLLSPFAKAPQSEKLNEMLRGPADVLADTATQPEEISPYRTEADELTNQRNAIDKQMADLENALNTAMTPEQRNQIQAQLDDLLTQRDGIEEQISAAEKNLEAEPDQWAIAAKERADKKAQYDALGRQLDDFKTTLGNVTDPVQEQAIRDQMAPLEEQREALRQELEIPTFGERIGDILTAAGTSVLAGNVDTQRNLYELGQGQRTRQTEERIAELEKAIEDENKQRAEDEAWYKEKYFVNGVDTGPGLDNWLSIHDNYLESFQRELDAYRQVVPAQEGATKETAAIADHFAELSSAATDKAKTELNGVESFLVDAGINGVQMLSDAAINLATGMPGSLVPLITRSYGSGTQQARQAGATTEQQALFGAASASVEALTEKMFDGLAGVYGKGMADDMTELIIDKVAKEASPTVKAALTIFLGGAGEATEEMVSGRLEPWLKAIYDKGEELQNTYGSAEGYLNSWAETGYSMLVGFAMGFAGTSVSEAQTAARETTAETQAETQTETPAETQTEAQTEAPTKAEAKPEAPQSSPVSDTLVDVLQNSRNAETGQVTRKGIDTILGDQALIDLFNENSDTQIDNKNNANNRAAIRDNADAVVAALTGEAPTVNTTESATAEVETPVNTAEAQTIPQASETATGTEVNTPTEETPVETQNNAVSKEAVEQAETAQESKAEPTAAELLRKGNNISNAEINRILANEEAVAALENIIGELPAQGKANAVRAFAQDAVENGVSLDAFENIALQNNARQRTTAQQRVVETLQKGDALTDEEIIGMLRKNRNALLNLGLDESITGLEDQIASVRALAEDIVQNGTPSEEAIAKINQDRDIQSQEQYDQYRIEQLEEELKAAEERGDIERRKALAKQIKTLRENAERKGLLKKISKTADKVAQAITRPNEKNHVLKSMRNATMDFIETINGARDNRTSTSETAIRASEKFDRITAEFERLRTMEDPVTGKVGEGFSSDVLAMMKSVSEMLGMTPLNELTNSELAEVNNALTAMNKSIRDANRLVNSEANRTAYESGHQMEQETRDTKGGENHYAEMAERPETFFNRLAGWVKNSEWHKWYERLNKGMHKVIDLKLQSHKMFNDLIGEKQYKTLRNEVKLKGLTDENGNPVKISRGMMLSLYLHLQNEQNTNHITGGGLTVADIADYYHARHDNGFGTGRARATGVSQELSKLNYEYRQAQNEYNDLVKQGNDNPDLMNSPEWQSRVDDVTFRMDSIKEGMEAVRESEADRIEKLRTEIENQLTDYERKFLSTAQDFFKWAQQNINDTTESVYGFQKALIENYFPVATDSNFRNVSLDEAARTAQSLENAGFVQRRSHSNSPMLLLDITDVLNNYINNMAQYCGAMPVVKDFNKVWNTTEAGYADSLRNAVTEKFGKGAVEYVDNLILDLQNARGNKANWLERYLNTTRGNFAASVLTLNARVAGSQAASWFNAAPVVGWDNLIKSIGMGKADLDLIRKYSPLLEARSQGKDVHNFSDLDLTVASQRERITKKFWFALNWINDVDNATVRSLWNAAERYVQNSNSELAQGTDEYYKEVGRVFDEVVERTQPSYEAMQRPGVLRDPSSLTRAVTMFMTQRLQNYNEVSDRLHQAAKYKQDFEAGKNGVTEADVKEANKAAVNAVTGTVASSVALTMMKAAIDGILHRTKKYRDEETGELTWESTSLRIMDYVAESLLSNALFGAEAYQLLKLPITGKYYGTSVPGVDTISDTVEDVLKAFKASKEKRPEAIAQAAGSLSSLLYGVPYDNAKGYVESVIAWADDLNNNTILESDKTYTTEQNKAIVYDALLGGDDGRIIRNDDRYDAAMKRMGKNAKSNATDAVKDHFNKGDIDYETAKDMLETVGYDADAAGKKILEWIGNEKLGSNFDAYQNPDNDYSDADLDEDLDRVKNMAQYRAMSPGQQDAALSAVYGYHKYLEEKEYAEANGIEYENDTYAKYEAMSDPVSEMIFDKRTSEIFKDGKEDFNAIDALIGSVDSMSEETRERFETRDYVKKLEDAADLEQPIKAADFFEIHDFANELSKQEAEAKKGNADAIDFNAVDAFVESVYNKKVQNDSKEADEVFKSYNGNIEELRDAAEAGIDSKTWYDVYLNSVNVKAREEEDYTDGDKQEDIHHYIDKMDLTPEQKALLKNQSQNKVYTTFAQKEGVYDNLVRTGLDPDSALSYSEQFDNLQPERNSRTGKMNQTVTSNQKARVVLSDENRTAAERVQTIIDIGKESSSLKPNQGEMARWLNTHFSDAEAKRYWKQLCDVYWSSYPSYGKALHS